MGGCTCLLSASLSAATSLHNKSLKTKDIYTEIIYNLAPHTKISQALQQFGAKDDETNIIAVTHDTMKQDTKFLELNILQSLPNVQGVKLAAGGEQRYLADLDDLRDLNAITKLYKLVPEEIKFVGVNESCLSRIACREFF